MERSLKNVMGKNPKEKNRTSLHPNKNKTAFAAALFAVITAMIAVFTGITTSVDCAQLYSLLHSDYTYSVEVQQAPAEDVYLRFDAGIGFTEAENSQTRINADIVMQPAEAVYTDNVYWNASELDTYEVAISENLARTEHLEIGDVIYSRHIADGEVYAYSVAQILPTVTEIRVTGTKNYSTGIIVMGYDARYAENISHDIIAFTNDSLETLASETAGMPTEILYRSDEIMNVCKEMLPYVALFAVLAMVAAAVEVVFLSKSIERNFKRKVSLGFEKKMLNRSYNVFVYGTGSVSILAAAFLSFFALHLFGCRQTETVLLLGQVIVEFVVMAISAVVLRRYLWRE